MSKTGMSSGVSKKATKNERNFSTIAERVEEVCKELLSRPSYRRGPFVIRDEDISKSAAHAAS